MIARRARLEGPGVDCASSNPPVSASLAGHGRVRLVALSMRQAFAIAATALFVLASSLPTAADGESSLLSALRKELVRTQEPKPPNERDWSFGTPDLAPLIGMTSGEILAGLGAPPDGSRETAAPSTDSGWVYLFDRLPAGWRGGGREIHLDFDSEGRCMRATWRYGR